MVNWVSSLLGEGTSPAIGIAILFIAAILALIAILWIAKRILGGTFVAGGRARHLRLAVMDATPVDSRRRLVLVRRDDVEHLILIGGPTDVVVEQNIKISSGESASSSQSQKVVKQVPEAAQPVEMQMSAQTSQPKTETQSSRPTPPLPPVTPAPAPVAAAKPATTAAPRPFSSTVTQPAPPRPAPTYTPPAVPLSRPIASTAPAVAAATPVVDALASLKRQEPSPSPTNEPSRPATPPESPIFPKPDTSTPVTQAASDPNDSVLADLSDEIARVSDFDAIDSEISLEQEMESILADLDVKSEKRSLS